MGTNVPIVPEDVPEKIGVFEVPLIVQLTEMYLLYLEFEHNTRMENSSQSSPSHKLNGSTGLRMERKKEVWASRPSIARIPFIDHFSLLTGRVFRNN